MSEWSRVHCSPESLLAGFAANIRARMFACSGARIVVLDAVNCCATGYGAHRTRPLPEPAIADSRGCPPRTRCSGRREDGTGKKTNGRKRHIAVDINAAAARGGARSPASILRPRRRAPSARRTAGAFFRDRMVWSDGGYRGQPTGLKHVLALMVQVIKRITGSTGLHVLPRVWVVERTFTWISKYRRCVRDYETGPDHHDAMISLMARLLART
ncbi:hypothetical protein FEZ60_26825 [Rhodococcus sp. MS16]|uniref:hypothetical protein n=1 Tax=Rhodococcus sp. MS16 TaxID=2579941 RepID=UPI0015628AF1|nr:hypothetical protein [Rhodococcus sp. MS16]NRI69143.1 hypothetical protein [Rhodococcus sp. MS16]